MGEGGGRVAGEGVASEGVLRLNSWRPDNLPVSDYITD